VSILLKNRKDMTLEACHAVAWQRAAVTLAPEAVQAMTQARQRFMALINEPDITIYGVTSGYGQHASRRLSPEDRLKHAQAPPFGPTAAWGDAVPERVSRAIVFARLANFIEGHAGVSPHIAIAVANMLDGRALPLVPARGQGGAGEIMSLAPLFVDLVRASAVGEKDVLSLINGSPSASALVADGALAAERRLTLLAQVFAFAAEAFNAPLTHFAEELGDYWNSASDQWALGQIRDLIGGGHGGARRPYQAPVSFRIMPRMLGQAKRAADFAGTVARESLAAVTDNPVLLPPDAEHPLGHAISTGGYHNPYVPMALDMLTAAYANLGVIAERMGAKLLDGPVSLLPPQLGADAGLSYLGCLPMALTGYEEEMRMLAQPTLLPGSESGGFGQNDVASPVFAAWSKQDRAALLLEQSLATLAAIAERAYRVTNRPVPKALKEISADVAASITALDAHEPIGCQIARLAQGWRDRIFAS